MKIFIGILLIGIVFAKQKECGRNAHFTDCGLPCPVTCDNRHNPPDACIMVCVSGCHCNEGFVRTRSGRCVKPQHCPKSGSPVQENCVDKPDNSLCRPRTLMWYFDQSKDSCQQFLYGGCGGNGNRFKTEAECMEKCKDSTAEVCGENERFNGCGTACPPTCENYDNPPNSCTLQCIIGCECEKGYVRRADGKCVRPELCPKKQPKSEEVDCTAPLDPGVCDAFISRFYYDPADENCKEFIYGGCQGNTNNFKTEEECKATCGAVLAKSSSALVEDKTDDINNVRFLSSTSTAKPFTMEVSPTEVTTETETTLTE